MADFEQEFARRVAPLRRACERRSERAEHRRGVEWGRRWQAGKGELEDGAERPWRELRDAYAEAADLLKRANDKVHGARMLLDKIRHNERIIDPEEMKNL